MCKKAAMLYLDWHAGSCTSSRHLLVMKKRERNFHLAIKVRFREIISISTMTEGFRRHAWDVAHTRQEMWGSNARAVPRRSRTLDRTIAGSRCDLCDTTLGSVAYHNNTPSVSS
ncbi:hypothetical protein J6590_044351 [Homalodisca vitripennis]|nr:hypothetical protein J6590_044351 [Homalodisca vitripennis]